MMALCDRGHDVTLYEKTDELGGSVIPAAFPPFKPDLQDYLKWLNRQIPKYPAKILLNTEATKEMLDKENYDAIIIAVGSAPIVPSSIPGIDKPHVHWAPDAEMGKAPVGDKLVVVGGGAVGIEAAIDFKQMSKDVIVVDMMDAETHLLALRKSSKRAGRRDAGHPPAGEHTAPPEHEAGRSERRRRRLYRHGDGRARGVPVRHGALVAGHEVRGSTSLTNCATAPLETDVFIIVGDALNVGNISTATNGGFQAAIHI